MDPVQKVKRELLLFKYQIIPAVEEKDEIIDSFSVGKTLVSRRALFDAIRARYCGISESNVTKYLHKLPPKRSMNVVFANKAPLKPIEANRPNQRHQMDLVDLGRVETGNDTPYRYALSVLDVFTR